MILVISLGLLFVLLIAFGVVIFLIKKKTRAKATQPDQLKLSDTKLTPIDIGKDAASSLESLSCNTRSSQSAATNEQTPQPHVADALETSLDLALTKTRATFWGRLTKALTNGNFHDSSFEIIEEVLYTSDLGPATVSRLLDKLTENLPNEARNLNGLRKALREELYDILSSVNPVSPVNQIPSQSNTLNPLSKLTTLTFNTDALNVWLIVGVNGAGKTTTIGKLAYQLASNGKKVLVAAGDTFRAAAGEQLKIWTERAQVEIFNPEGVSDPSAIAFDACQKAKAKNFDFVLIDTAGRLHTQKNLMEELRKVKRVIQKVVPNSPHEILLVLDANTGQNGLVQAREFNEALQITGVILTKLDGTAKGGVAVGIAAELHIPIKLIGVGEGLNDLRPFDVNEFVDSLLVN